MSSIIVKTAVCEALEILLVLIEGSFSRGFSGIELIGSHSAVTKGGLDRAKTALENIGIRIPAQKIVISMVPAEIKKDSSHFDLPFALCLYFLTQKKQQIDKLSQWLFAAELGLDGSLRPVKGAVCFALQAIGQKLQGIVVAKSQVYELEKFVDLQTSRQCKFQVMGFDNLKEVFEWIEAENDILGNKFLNKKTITLDIPYESHKPNFDDMLLDQELSLAALVAASGKHSIGLYGCPGSGKSMFSSRIASILPPMSQEEHIETMRIHSLNQPQIKESILSGRPPFRSPHHQASAVALIGTTDKPGELALAHGGILFLDEIPEFRRDLIEALREPLEEGKVSVVRAKRHVIWKCNAILVIASNNCPCGWLGSSQRRCICPTAKILAYKRKLSGPFLDRLDVHINVKEVAVGRYEFFNSLSKQNLYKSGKTKELAAKVVEARKLSWQRNKEFGVTYNSELKAQDILAACKIEKDIFESTLCTQKFSQLTTRSLIRCLRVSRTLADIDKSKQVCKKHIEDALVWSAVECARQRKDHAYGSF
jgi:magnesium chelatase family protein